MNTLHIPCKTGQISDGYHTFDELYEHRCLLFLNLMATRPEISWRTRRHEDGTAIKGYWIAGMRLPSGDVTYHVPNRLWRLLDKYKVKTLPRAPKWDGHTSADVVKRLSRWLSD
jgi:hypothetical protein